jgi:multicomponent Na+:H+ antiporter subunit F
METGYLLVELFLVLNILLGLIRIVRGPSPVDRILAVQLFGTTGVALLLIMAHRMEMPTLRNVALVFGLLATLAFVAFARLVGPDADEVDSSEAAS